MILSFCSRDLEKVLMLICNNESPLDHMVHVNSIWEITFAIKMGGNVAIPEVRRRHIESFGSEGAFQWHSF